MSGQACQRPDCTGTYEDVGGGELYCDTCGLAPVVSANGMVGSPPTGIAAEGAGAAGRRGGAARQSGAGAGEAGSGAKAAAGGSARGSDGGGRGGGESGGSGGGRGSGSPASGRPSSPRGVGGTPSSRSATSRRSVSGRLSRSLRGGAATHSVSVRSSGTTSSSRGRLGAGLVKMPDVPRPDPRAMVLEHPEVPERKRFCSRSDCGAPVGRARGGRPGRTEGFCTKCGNPYSFVPKLHPGDIVHGQYEVVGCLAHGGLGWIYLAVDRAVSDRWVVLKGLLDTGDQDAMAAAISERRFLAEIEHSNIVRIYNFVEHLDQRTGSMDGYIVMEYVGGKSLKEIANSRRTREGRRDPLPVGQACAYGIETLEALGHLHSRNLLYCDFKVDNAIQTEDQLKLIDMGAVRRMDDDESAIFGTIGYQAPEVAELGPSVASDLYTVARTLAVLTFDFQGYTNVFVNSLPDPDNIEVFRQYESFYRLLVRATDPDPARRFASAQEMAEQLTGVLREVVALQTGRPRPALSPLFGPELKVTDTELFRQTTPEVSLLGPRPLPAPRGSRAAGARAGLPGAGGGGASQAIGATAMVGPAGPGGTTTLPAPPTEPPGAPAPTTAAPAPAPHPHSFHHVNAAATALALPIPRVDATDPNAGFLAGLLASAPTELISALAAAPATSLELRLRELRARLEMGELAAAADILDAVRRDHPDDWRVIWYQGVVALATGDHARAALSFDAVYDAFPGEPAPKIALGVCAEVLGQLDNAAEYYRLVWTTDPSYVSAAFGLARVRFASGDRRAAVRTLESVPESSIHYTAARVAAVRARLRHRLTTASTGSTGSTAGAAAAEFGRRRRAGEPSRSGTATGSATGGRTGTGAGAPPAPGAADPSFLEDLTAAADQVEALDGFGLDAVRRELLSTEVLGSALDWVLSGSQDDAPPPGGRTTLLGSQLNERGLRFGLERSYRTLARLTDSGRERIELVERANRLRPRTWV